MPIIPERTLDQQANVLVRYFPNDNIYSNIATEGSNFRKLLYGIAKPWLQQVQLINHIYDEYFPDSTTDFLEEWERMVGIPDDIFDTNGTNDERRNNILLKLSGLDVTTAKQFENVASILGITVVVADGVAHSVLPLELPFVLLDAVSTGFVIVVSLDSSFSGTPDAIILEALFNKLKPANTKVIFRYT